MSSNFVPGLTESLLVFLQPTDRIIDGVDQMAFLTQQQPKSNREGSV